MKRSCVRATEWPRQAVVTAVMASVRGILDQDETLSSPDAAPHEIGRARAEADTGALGDRLTLSLPPFSRLRTGLALTSRSLLRKTGRAFRCRPVRDEVDVGADGNGPVLVLLAACRAATARSGRALSLSVDCGSDLPARGKQTYGKRPASSKPSPSAFFPAGTVPAPRGRFALKKAAGSGAPHSLCPAWMRVRRRCARHHGLAIARGSAPREQQMRTRP